MKRLFKSEITNKVYETEEECLKAEKEHQELVLKQDKAREERKEKAKVIEDKYKEYVSLCSDNRTKERELYSDYLKLRDEFVDKYGSYHLTVTQKSNLKPLVDFDSLNKLVDSFFTDFWF